MLELASYLSPNRSNDCFGAFPASFDEFVDARTGFGSLQFAVLDQFRHQVFGPFAGHVGEGQSGIDIPLKGVVCRHKFTLSFVLATSKHFANSCDNRPVNHEVRCHAVRASLVCHHARTDATRLTRSGERTATGQSPVDAPGGVTPESTRAKPIPNCCAKSPSVPG